MNTTTYDGFAQRFAADAGQRLKRTTLAVTHGFRTHAALHGLAILTCLIGIIESWRLGVPVSFSLVSLVTGSTFIFLFLIIGLWMMAEFVRLWWTGYKGSPALALRAKLLDDILAPGRVANTLHAFTANGIFFIGFLTIKKNIPIAVPFGWDRTFMEWDKALHFGMLPHELLAPLFQYPLITFVVNVNYNLWFAVITAFFFWQGFRKDDTALRQRYLLAYLLTWFMGTCVVGTILSSAGPCFYAMVEQGANPYAGLLAYMREANAIYPIWAVPTQDLLWQTHLAGFGEVEGVSAMPSMHVGTTILFICCAMQARIRWLTWCATIFAVTILFGSVLLAWHYAVDGYVGAAVAWACWKLAGWWVDRNPPVAA